MIKTDNTKVNLNLLKEVERLKEQLKEVKTFNKCLIIEVRSWDNYTDKEIEDIKNLTTK